MIRVPISRSETWLALLVLAAPTLLLGWRQSRLQVDPENRSLRDPASQDARALARREREFGADRTALLSVAGADPSLLRLSDSERDAMEELETELRSSAGVAGLTRWPSSPPGVRDFVLELVPRGADGAAAAVAEVQRLAAAHQPTLHARLTGLPVAEAVIAQAAQAERLRMVPRLLAMLVVLLTISYRSLRIAAAVLLPALMGIAWTGGLFERLGRRLDPVSVLLDPVLLTVGVASGVQLCEAYLARRAAGRPPWDAARESARDTAQPAMLAALTTVVGFLSLATQGLPAVVDFGLFAALGVALTFLLGLLLTPALLALFGAREPERAGALPSGSRRTAWVGWISRHAAGIRWTAGLLALGGAACWLRLRVDNDPLAILPVDHPLRSDTAALAERLGGVETFELYLPSGDPGADDARLALLGAHLLEQPGVAGPAGFPRRSSTGSTVIPALLEPSGASRREQLFDAVDAHLVALGSTQARAVGLSVQVARDSTRLVRGQMRGTLFTVAALWGVFLWVLRSRRLSAIAMAPNLLPGLSLYGALAAVGRPLSVATAMISSVMLGLIVDSTIHFLHHYGQAASEGKDRLGCVEAAVQRAGRGILRTATVLALGFSVGASGSLGTTVEFGVLASATIVLALLAVLVVLPALLLAGPSPSASIEEASRARAL